MLSVLEDLGHTRSHAVRAVDVVQLVASVGSGIVGPVADIKDFVNRVSTLRGLGAGIFAEGSPVGFSRGSGGMERRGRGGGVLSVPVRTTNTRSETTSPLVFG
jgi:hypothetical protein